MSSGQDQDEEKRAKSTSDAARALGRLGASKGGLARAEKLTPEERSEIARKAVQTRWANKGDTPTTLPREVHSGVLTIGDIPLPCAVVMVGGQPIRLFTQESFLQAIGRSRTAKGGEGASVVDGSLPFLAANNLKPFLENGLKTSTTPIIYRPLRAGKAFGFRAELLPEVCWIYLEARNAKSLHPQQLKIAERCEILLRGMATVGIIALVDEATGYQESRAKDELQKILDAYIVPELRKWTKVFPDEFFRQVYRIHGWEFKPGTAKRTPMVGKIIKKYVYGQLPPGVLAELQRRNPVMSSGRRRDKHHQWLTEGIGCPHLEQQIMVVTMFMKGAPDREMFEAMFERAFAKEVQGRLPLIIDVSSNDESPDRKSSK